MRGLTQNLCEISEIFDQHVRLLAKAFFDPIGHLRDFSPARRALLYALKIRKNQNDRSYFKVPFISEIGQKVYLMFLSSSYRPE